MEAPHAVFFPVWTCGSCLSNVWDSFTTRFEVPVTVLLGDLMSVPAPVGFVASLMPQGIKQRQKPGLK